MSFYLGSNRRDFSDKSRDGENWKKVKESNSLSSPPEEVFSNGFNSPELANLLVNFLKCIENQVKRLFTFHKETKESQINVTDSKFDDIENQIRKKTKRLIS